MGNNHIRFHAKTTSHLQQSVLLMSHQLQTVQEFVPEGNACLLLADRPTR